MLDVIIEITKPVYFGAVFTCKSVFHFLLIFDFFFLMQDLKQRRIMASLIPGDLVTAKYLHSHMRHYGCKLPFWCMHLRTMVIINTYLKHHLSELYKDCMRGHSSRYIR